MPIYEFRCKKCNEQIEVLQKLYDKQPTRCRKCGGRLEKLASASSIQFKGEGWYVTDYGQKKTKPEKESSSEKKESSSEKKESSSETPATTEKAKPKETSAKKTGSDAA